MCGLCGMLVGAERGVGRDASLFAPGASTPQARQERHKRLRLLNQVLRHYRLTLADFAGSGFVLRGPTGRSELVASVGDLWPAAERLAGKPCDPLDSALLAALDGRAWPDAAA